MLLRNLKSNPVKVICINADGWSMGNNKECSGPSCGAEYTVVDTEGNFYELSEFLGNLYPQEEFVPTTDTEQAEEKTLSKVFSH